MKRKIAVLLTICMLFTMVPSVAFAATDANAKKEYKVAAYTPSAEAAQAEQDVRDAAKPYIADAKANIM